MGEVIGPMKWSTEDRKETWLVMRELREIIKLRKELIDLRRRDPANDNSLQEDALNRETIYYNTQFKRWMVDSKEEAA